MVGDRIKEARLALGYSAEQVASFLNVSPATIYRYENGDISKLPSKHIRPLAQYLCVTPEYLMEWTDENTFDKTAAADQPKNDDIRLLIRGLNKLSPDQIEQAKNVFRAMFAITNPDLFEKGDDDQ